MKRKPDTEPQKYDRVSITRDDGVWGDGWIEQVYTIGGRTTGYRVNRNTGAPLIVRPDEVRKK